MVRNTWIGGEGMIRRSIDTSTVGIDSLEVTIDI